jgi:hypothetical protein
MSDTDNGGWADPSDNPAFIDAESTPNFFAPYRFSTFRDDSLGDHTLGWYQDLPYPKGWPAAKQPGMSGLSGLPVSSEE